ncbi:lymphoid-specific helicase-like [Daphnia carinata]|uniref:lymphoid-specific helicase-like n=1 Tax=Daphnia carinata TaxID=120202 RepID=UPI002580F708|nr:lymphoid-specific helicase-like [Daphnia carinata]
MLEMSMQSVNDGGMFDLPEDIRKEGEELTKEIEQEESENDARLLKAQQLENQSSQPGEMRYKRLMCLLDRSKFYANFLLQRMNAKKEEEKIKQEKLAKKEAAEKKKLKENDIANQLEEPPSDIVKSEKKTRGAKRQTELLSPNEKTGTASRKRLRKNNLSEANILNVLDEKELRKRAAHADADEEVEPVGEDLTKEVKNEEQMPELFEGGTMRSYQMEGYRWLVSLYENGMNGILADEMGLGKTVQCISLVAHLMDKGVTGPFLVCAPLSTLPNWMSEFKRFSPRIPTVLYHGNQEKRDEVITEIRQKFKIPGINGLKFFPVVITSFEVVIRDRKVLEQLQWRYIIVDEGHRLKNYQCRLVQELKKYPSSNRLLLTGTPLQNNLSELWSLLNFLLPEIFDDLDVFTEWFRVEELQGSEIDHKIVEMERKENVLSMLHQILSPFLLRRLKTDVDLQIPKKKELLVYCPMSKLQDELYRATVDRSIAFLLGGQEEKTQIIEYQANGRPKRKAKRQDIDYSNMGTEEVTEELEKISVEKQDEEIDEWMKLSNDLHWEPRKAKKRSIQAVNTSIKMNNPMMQLRKIVNHPYLVKWEVDIETGDYIVDEAMVSDSGKLAVMDQMLKRLIKDGHKVLIFSQLTMMLDVLADYLSMRGLKFGRLDGRMNLEERAVDMDKFRNDPDMPVFLISTRAGGLGITLTSADTVIIYDSDWNPQCDLQAQDRCHRIGQTKPVVVYRLVTSDTVDQRIIDRAGAKRKLEKMVIQKGKFKSGLQAGGTSSITTNELIELLKARDHNGEYRSSSGQVFTEEEMDALMDRSDLVSEAGIEVKEEITQLQGVFKRLDIPPEEIKKEK